MYNCIVYSCNNVIVRVAYVCMPLYNIEIIILPKC